jgi:hypothetical protein
MENTNSEPKKRKDFFVILAVAYFALPNLIFLATWIRPWIGIPAALAVAFFLIIIFREGVGLVSPPSLDRNTMIFIVALALFWTLLAGVGGFAPQSEDYIKHNLVFHDLVHSAWPVNYALPGGGQNYLCYSVGYYLVPGSLAKIFGDAVLPLATFFWSAFGVGLFFYWVARFNAKTNPGPKMTLVIFLLCAVTGIVWFAFKNHAFSGARDYMIKLGLVNSYLDSFTRLEFQPQHTITGWLGAALLAELIWVQKNPRAAAFVWSLTLLWSVLTSAGLLLLPLAALRRVRLPDYFTPANLIGGGMLVAVMGIYYQGHTGLSYDAPIWKLSNGADWLMYYALFLVFQLSLVALIWLVDSRYSVLKEWRTLFLWSAIFLILLPLFRVGYWSDLRLEGASPALVFIALGASRCFNKEFFQFRKPLFAIFLGVFLLGAIYPAGRPLLNLAKNRDDNSYAGTLRRYGFHNLTEIYDPTAPTFNAAEQYLGRTDSVAARWLMR